jgi:predicted RNA methylase
MAGKVLRARAKLGADFDEGQPFDTAGSVPVWMLDITSPNAHLGEAYEPSAAEDLLEALASLNVDSCEYSFIDIGCGKGKPLIVAARSGYTRLIGVEFARDLADKARANLRACGLQDAVIFNIDAVDYQFPASPFVAFMYNPFGPEIMKHVVANLMRTSHRDFVIVYSNPTQRTILAESGFLRMVQRFTHTWPTEIWLPIRS